MKKTLIAIILLSGIFLGMTINVVHNESISDADFLSDDIIINIDTSVTDDPNCSPNGIDIGEPPARDPRPK